jgi:hypothetical protein
VYKRQAINKATYITELVEWRKIQAQYSVDRSLTKKRIAKLERKNKVVQNARDGDPITDTSDPKLNAIQGSKDKLDISIDQLDILIDSVDLVLQPLPIAMKPNTSNFGITAKNRKPIFEIGDNMDTQVKQPGIDAILKTNELKSDNFMSTGFSGVAQKKLNRSKLNNKLKAAMPTLIDTDPFPKYENLSPTNLAWTPFLITKWGPAGAKSYGIPA